MKKILSLCAFLAFFAVAGFASLEAGPSFAATSNATSTVSLTVESEIALSGCTGAITMSPNLSLSQDSATGTVACTVETTNTTGYTLSLKATSSPAMTSGSNSFGDYATTTGPTTWSVAAANYQFGFSAYGADADTKWGTGSSCGTAGTDTFTANGTMKYAGFQTTATTTAVSANATPGGGTITNICFAAEQGNNVNAPSGVYTATIVATAATQ